MPTLTAALPVITLPGIDGSGASHWQSRWEAADPTFTRFQPTSWTVPTYTDWAHAIDDAVLASPRPPLLIAHSLATLAVASWVVESGRPIAGAVLVSVPDPAGPSFPTRATGFSLSTQRLPCPSLVLASSDDPYGTLDHQRRAASVWGASLIELGHHGHVNEESGLGFWVRGHELVSAFRAGLTG